MQVAHLKRPKENNLSCLFCGTVIDFFIEISDAALFFPGQKGMNFDFFILREFVTIKEIIKFICGRRGS